MKRWIRRLAVLAAVVVIIVGLRFTVFRPQPVPVTIYTVARGRVESSVVNSRAGTVHSRQEAALSPGLSGLIAEIPVEKGQRVEKGQVLLRLDDAELQAQTHLAERALEAVRSAEKEACLAADQAAREFERNRALHENGLVSQDMLDRIETRRDVTRAGCDAARERTRQAAAAVDAARATLDKTVLTAPFSGVVADITSEEREWISPSMPGLMIPTVVDIVDPDHLYVRAPLDEVDAGRVRIGLPARITMDAFSAKSFPAVVSWIAPRVDARVEQNRTLSVEATFDSTADLAGVLPGLSADLEIILDARDEVLRIPSYALLEGDRVLAVENGRLEERAVETGLRNWSFTEITTGLEPGSKIVVSLDRVEVRAGAQVRVADEIHP
jgi:HlyD family secretion protein